MSKLTASVELLSELVRVVAAMRGIDKNKVTTAGGELPVKLVDYGWQNVEVSFRCDNQGEVYGAVPIEIAGIAANVYDPIFGHVSGELTEIRVYIDPNVAV